MKEKLKALKAADPKDKKIGVLETKIEEQEKAAREAQAKADAIDAAVFDLKAVNPNAVVKIDRRTPEEVIQSIAAQERSWPTHWTHSRRCSKRRSAQIFADYISIADPQSLGEACHSRSSGKPVIPLFLVARLGP